MSDTIEELRVRCEKLERDVEKVNDFRERLRSKFNIKQAEKAKLKEDLDIAQEYIVLSNQVITERDQARAELNKFKEDARLLREQIRVGDEAFNFHFAEHPKLMARLKEGEALLEESKTYLGTITHSGWSDRRDAFLAAANDGGEP